MGGVRPLVENSTNFIFFIFETLPYWYDQLVLNEICWYDKCGRIYSNRRQKLAKILNLIFWKCGIFGLKYQWNIFPREMGFYISQSKARNKINTIFKMDQVHYIFLVYFSVKMIFISRMTIKRKMSVPQHIWDSIIVFVWLIINEWSRLRFLIIGLLI